jgi:hypothetical protein
MASNPFELTVAEQVLMDKYTTNREYEYAVALMKENKDEDQPLPADYKNPPHKKSSLNKNTYISKLRLYLGAAARKRHADEQEAAKKEREWLKKGN